MVRTIYRAAMLLTVATLVLNCASTGQRAPRHGAQEDAAVSEVPSGMVTVGMTKSQVRRLWGEPKDISSGQEQPGAEIWTYEFRKAMAGTQTSGGARAVIQRTIYRLTFEGEKLKGITETDF